MDSSVFFVFWGEFAKYIMALKDVTGSGNADGVCFLLDRLFLACKYETQKEHDAHFNNEGQRIQGEAPKCNAIMFLFLSLSLSQSSIFHHLSLP